jgi:hypothetical protein
MLDSHCWAFFERDDGSTAAEPDDSTEKLPCAVGCGPALAESWPPPATITIAATTASSRTMPAATTRLFGFTEMPPSGAWP